MTRKITLISRYLGRKLNLVLSDFAFHRLRSCDDPMEEINLDLERASYGIRPHTLSRRQCSMVRNFFPKDDNEYFDSVDLHTFMVVAKCDPYNAKRHYLGGKVIRRDGGTPVEWVHNREERLTLKEANDLLFLYASEIAGHKFDNWGLAVLHLEKYSNGTADCGTRKDGTRWLRDDTMTYSVEKE